tara:strand:+ start:5966 stop:6121 length:156 start_codon:yes stop_codon:yes gene_type:complete
MNVKVKINISTEDFSLDEILELIEWKLDALQKEMPGKVNFSMAGYEINTNK